MPHSGPVAVTGATGGVGSLALALLARCGYEAVAVTGKPTQAGHLRRLGAARIVERHEFIASGTRSLGPELWAGVIDCVGGPLLAAALKTARYGAAISCCGMAASPTLETSIFPFILRGVHLLGIDSVACPMPKRLKLWAKMSGPWRVEVEHELIDELGLSSLKEPIAAMLEGRFVGRALVNPNQG